MRVLSHLPTRVAYTHPASDEAPFPTETIELAPGDNNVTVGQLERLRGNSLFQRHEAGGHVVVVDDALTEDDSPNLPDAAATVWDRREGEKAKAYAARIAALDAFVADVAPLPEAERDAMMGAASEDEKAALLTPKPEG
jgi:hypothetical protein